MKFILSTTILLGALIACSSNNPTSSTSVSPANPTDWNAYWYNGQAEISSYTLQQARYGEIHKGSAVLLYVTEPFSIASNAKANRPTTTDPSVLKLNFEKKFTTGIYPYSIMTSTFLPVQQGEHSLKISSTSQEWCGHTYMELRNKKQFEIQVASYFEGESKNKKLEFKHLLEDDLWSKIRINPAQLPVGKQQLIPSFAYLRLMHQPIKGYEVLIEQVDIGNGLIEYNLEFPDLERRVTIQYEANFPHRIKGWEETYPSGFGANKKMLTTKATLTKTIQVDYWNKNSVNDGSYRKQLGL